MQLCLINLILISKIQRIDRIIDNLIESIHTNMFGKIKNNALVYFIRTHYYVLRRKLHFTKSRNGEIITTSDGKEYVIFRGVTVDHKKNLQENSNVILKIQFNFKSGSAKTNKRLSAIAIPFIAGFPGFRSKYWMIHEPSGGFQGIYEWDTIKDIENYKKSFAIKIMSRRATVESINFETISN